jgi:hypothetical protein
MNHVQVNKPSTASAIVVPLALLALLAVMTGCGGQDPLSTEAGETVSGGDAKTLDAADQPVDVEDKPGVPGGPPDSPPGGMVEHGTEVIIDQGQAEKGGPSQYWHTQTGLGIGGNMMWTYVNGSSVSNWMRWHSGQAAGQYQVWVYIPWNYGTTRSANYQVQNGSSTFQTVTVNQYNYSDVWVCLGTFNFSSEPCVFLGDNTGESYSGTHRMVGFDAVKFVQIGTGGGGGGGGIGLPCFWQKDPAWSGKRMYPSTLTLGGYGCLVTVMASVAEWAGYGTNPGIFCDWLSGHGGFTSTGLLSSSNKLSEYTGGKAAVTASYNWASVSADMGKIKSEIDAGRPVMLKVHYAQSDSDAYQHWVLATSYSTTNGAISDIKIMDPLESSRTPVSINRYVYNTSIARWIFGAKTVKRN